MGYLRHKKKLIVILISLIFLAGLSISIACNPVKADTGLTIQPIKISQTMEPGESISGVITLKSASSKAVKVEVKVEDFVPTAGASGIQFVGRTSGITTVRDWITIGGDESFTFQKGESREIPYTIDAPLNAEPGSHFGVAFFKATELGEEGKQLKVGTQVGMLIFVTIPGNFLQKGKILDFSSQKFVQKGPVNFKIKFENTGTVHFEPKGEIKITNIFGKEVGSIPVAGQAVLPTGVRDLDAQWNISGFLLGRYKAALSMTDGEGNELTADSISFYAFPIWYLLGFILSVIVLFYGLKFLRNRLNISVSFKK
jgi:hypothetical protein